MLKFRRPQLDALGQVALATYRSELLEHYRVFAPELFRVAGDEQFRAFIQYGTDKALGIGLRLRGPMRLFLDVMCILGQDFDIDTQYPPLWHEGDPAEIPLPFAQRLRANFADFVDRCVGADRVIQVGALQGVLSMPLDPDGSFRIWIRGALADIYPEKLDYMGEDNFTALLDACDETAASASVVTPRGRLLIVILTVTFGVNFLSNPLYPWVAKRLLADAPEDARVEKTFSALRIYSAEMLKNLEQGA